MTTLAFVALAAGWALWLTPFVRTARGVPRAATVDRRARWGIALQGVAYAILWQGPFWDKQFRAERHDTWPLVAAAVCLTCACALSWTATGALGRHLRVDAGLSADHALVRSGPYRMVRHPIYTSMFCILIATGIVVAPSPLFTIALVVFLVGTEIRVRLEDALLASRFGDEFTRYRREVRAYIPFVR